LIKNPIELEDIQSLSYIQLKKHTNFDIALILN